MHAEKGASLLELLVVLALASTLSSALVLLTRTTQVWALQLNQLLERDEDAQLAPLILLRAASQAGNNRIHFTSPAVETTSQRLSLRSDFDGAGHFPDGVLRDPFESIQYRCLDGQLQARSGNGTFQSILKHTPRASWHWDGATSMNIDLTTSVRLPMGARDSERELKLRFFLWNFRKQLFGIQP